MYRHGVVSFEETRPLLARPHCRVYIAGVAERTRVLNSSVRNTFDDIDGHNVEFQKGLPNLSRVDGKGWIQYQGDEDEDPLQSFPPRTSEERLLAAFIGSVMLLSISAIIFLIFSNIRAVYSSSAHNNHVQAADPMINFFPPNIQHSWAAYTPYFPVARYIPPPVGCTITQVNIIQRHGARFPTSGASKRIKAVVAKLQNATHFTDPRLDFLSNFTYTLGTDSLVPFGAFQSRQAGQQAFQRYSSLISSSNLPFIRASSSQRVVDSANNWTAGFSLASHGIFNPSLSVILNESLNDTLDDSMCPNAGDSDFQTGVWTATYGAPIAARLDETAPGSNVLASEISDLIPLCPFETLANQRASPFCALFTPDEFAQFEYFGDLDKFYGTGYGQPLGRVQGVGYVNELIARLTGTTVEDQTQTNRTLDSSPTTFPLDRTIYADFSHDNQLIAIYSAMGLFKQPTPLDPTKPNPKRSWVDSQMTPFSARMVTERLSCPARGNLGFFSNKKRDTFVRVLVNDAPQPLEFCGGDKDGLCELEAFVESQAYARNNGEGDFEKCFS